MTKLLGLSGSLRAASYNTALLKAAQGLAGDGIELDAATVHDVPLYDGDEEERLGTPAAVRELKERILAAQGLLLVTPEYNNGIPGVFKNTIDWLSRPTPGLPDVFRGRPVAVIGASPGGFGTTLAQSHWLPVLRMLGVRPWHGGRLMVARAGSVFDADGRLVDEGVARQLAEFVQGFAAYAAAQR
ncbi:MAG: NAD(P)H-dependent oxidoreductase [Burkholderiales bacterium]|nr:NAD(P)H-dependent oxidoreductase [Burkholderiales bacterium]MDE1926899.1 NAD(P)H-dependent oxidoreductase [Burkholderiales bacterium]MDE2157518.1 NAD(P)H-dependent oxidoreductase [Burkholderiales bacterium]MDE2501724.1 NAD(P)H-dependent oxidoreductase [Burkholderiales bacterium]